VISVDETVKRLSLLPPKQQVRRTVSDDNRLQQQQQLPRLNTQHLSAANHEATSPASPVSTFY